MLSTAVATGVPDAGLVLGAVTAAPLAAVRVDFDATVVYAALLFVTLMLVLNRILFAPLLKVFEARERRTSGARAEARRFQEEAGELLLRVEREVERIQRVATAERDRIRSETAKLEATILAEARAAADRIVDEGRAKTAYELAALRRDLEVRTPQLASEIATRALGREVH
ncbi:MAG: ATP synthase F0 subunit B [Polyangiaceae bacterium]|nr:ATP synthase F0 subunit B [Polyangiaceae bacterium]